MSKHAEIARARTFLFVPGDRPERFEKALASGADAVVLDVEDAVGLERKPAARAAIAEFAKVERATGTAVLVRVNASTTELGLQDIEWLAQTSGIDGVLVPKAESAQAIQDVAGCLPNLAIVAIIETARGYWNVREVANAPQVARLAFGHLDFIADTGIRLAQDEAELNPARFAISLASRDANLPPPIDGVTVEIQDEERLGADVSRSVRFGFAGKLCIHPKQVAAVHRLLAPTQEEVEWATKVVLADKEAAGAAVQLDGRMIDAPVVLRAKKTLELHRRHTSGGD